MTMIDVDTSPLQAAREWRGIGLVAAALNAGLPMAQAEALEEGDATAFNSIDEMIAAAVVYGASLGIGRDEAVALLDRTVCGTGAQVALPDDRPNAGFSEAVQERSARIADRAVVSTTPILDEPVEAQGVELPVEPELELEAIEIDVPAAERAMPEVPHGPTPEQAVAASGEIHLDDTFGPEAPWERSSHTSELEAWAEDFRDADEDSVALEPVAGIGERLGARIGAGTHAALERLVGTEKADAAADWMRATNERIAELIRDGRERLRRSEHATLIVAIGAGAVLIALVVALGGALGGSDEPKSSAAPDRATATATSEADATATDAAATDAPASAPAAAKPGPMLPPARLKVDVYNAGSKKGYAKEVASKLEAAGYRIGEVTNAKSSYAGATIIHPADMAREARVLARRTGIATLQEAPGSTRTITIVVT